MKQFLFFLKISLLFHFVSSADALKNETFSFNKPATAQEELLYEKVRFVLSTGDFTSDPSFNLLWIGNFSLEVHLNVKFCHSYSYIPCTELISQEISVPTASASIIEIFLKHAEINNIINDYKSIFNDRYIIREDFYTNITISENSDTRFKQNNFSSESYTLSESNLENKTARLRAYYIEHTNLTPFIYDF